MDDNDKATKDEPKDTEDDKLQVEKTEEVNKSSFKEKVSSLLKNKKFLVGAFAVVVVILLGIALMLPSDSDEVANDQDGYSEEVVEEPQEEISITSDDDLRNAVGPIEDAANVSSDELNSLDQYSQDE